MRDTSVWRQLLGLVNVVVEGVEVDEQASTLVVAVRPRKGGAKTRCGICGRRCGRYDRGDGRRRWRSLDVGVWRCFLEAEAPRVRCRRRARPGRVGGPLGGQQVGEAAVGHHLGALDFVVRRPRQTGRCLPVVAARPAVER